MFSVKGTTFEISWLVYNLSLTTQMKQLTGQRPNKVHMDVGEPPGRDRNLRNSRMNMLMNLTPLTLNTGSGPGEDISRESSQYK